MLLISETVPRRSEMQSEYKEKQEDAKGNKLKAIFNVHFTNLVSKNYFSIQRLRSSSNFLAV